MKKFLAFVLATVMLAAIAVPALAAIVPPDSDPNAVCNHSSKTLVDTRLKFTPIDDYDHKVESVKTYICDRSVCGATIQETTYVGDSGHSMEYYSASCNGRLQTIVKQCSDCYKKVTETVRCPGANHTGSSCRWLPY